MGQPVVHFEVVGKDGEKLQSYYAELFDWNVDSEQRDEIRPGRSRGQHATPKASASAAASARGPEGYEGHVTFYVEVPASRRR